jgi:hypothetical protein
LKQLRTYVFIDDDLLNKSKDIAAIYTYTLSCVDCYVRNYWNATVSLVLNIFVTMDNLILIISVMNLDNLSILNKERLPCTNPPWTCSYYKNKRTYREGDLLGWRASDCWLYCTWSSVLSMEKKKIKHKP